MLQEGPFVGIDAPQLHLTDMPHRMRVCSGRIEALDCLQRQALGVFGDGLGEKGPK